jgi:tetratricopeptide (TPR) repeat protein
LNGEIHIDTIQYLASDAHLLMLMGRPAQSLDQYRRANETLAKVLSMGATNEQGAALVLDLYGRDLMLYGRLEESLATFSRAQAQLGRASDSDIARAALLRRDLARLYIDLGRYQDAQRLLGESDAMHRRIDHRAVSDAEEKLPQAALLIAQRRTSELDALIKTLPDDAGATASPSFDRLRRNDLRATLAMMKNDHHAALNLARADLAQIERSSSRDAYAIFELKANQTAGNALRSLGQPTAALSALNRAVELAERVYDNTQSPGLAEALIDLAHCLLDMKQSEQAIALARKARAIQASHKELGEHYRAALRRLQARLP